ncbi:MAG: hypothetical protein KGZ39_04235 [Simkania sp.]|nr:hypothetical protein [Simkania sp.]
MAVNIQAIRAAFDAVNNLTKNMSDLRSSLIEQQRTHEDIPHQTKQTWGERFTTLKDSLEVCRIQALVLEDLHTRASYEQKIAGIDAIVPEITDLLERVRSRPITDVELRAIEASAKALEKKRPCAERVRQLLEDVSRLETTIERGLTTTAEELEIDDDTTYIDHYRVTYEEVLRLTPTTAQQELQALEKIASVLDRMQAWYTTTKKQDSAAEAGPATTLPPEPTTQGSLKGKSANDTPQPRELLELMIQQLEEGNRNEALVNLACLASISPKLPGKIYAHLYGIHERAKNIKKSDPHYGKFVFCESMDVCKKFCHHISHLREDRIEAIRRTLAEL